MTGIDRVGPAPSSASTVRAARAGAVFSMPGAAETDAMPAAVSAAAPMALESLLALQQVDQATERDRAARRRGQALLVALGRVQLGLLGGGDPAATLAELRTLAADVPPASDSGLAAALAHVVLRARIELARRGG
jgi:Class II flagellar assembly regulator